MADPESIERTTLQFCRSTSGGQIIPSWDESRAVEMEGQFEIGLKVANRYLLKEKLGNGAMGRVFLATDLRLNRNVAIKVVVHERTAADLESSLQREARLGANLNHRGIAAVFDFGFHEDKSYTVFEYIEGETLRSLMARRGRIPLDETLPIVNDLAAALDYAHAHGVVHRDLKPENICFTKTGEFKILDLGIAFDAEHKLANGFYSGTPAYSSPEQADCRWTDGRSDQYSLALIVFEMLTAEKAFTAKTPLSLLQKHIHQPPRRPREISDAVSESAESAILRALNKSPLDRYSNCQEFVFELGAGLRPQARRKIVSPTPDRRVGFYLAHVAEESLLASRMAKGLREHRYSSWYYGRDALPGVPFTRQSNLAIEQSQAVVVLISRHALRSSDFAREIEYAHKIGCPILPLLVDVTREEFDKLAPAWSQMLGVSPKVEYRRSEPLDDVVNRIAQAAESLDIEVDDTVIVEQGDQLQVCAGPAWATDANQIAISDLDRILFRNATIDGFLQSGHRYFISATKGFGKTLLLTYKRHLLTQSSTAKRSITMVPEGRPYLDFMSEMRSLSAKFEAPLSDVSNTKRLWNAAFRISAISHHADVIDQDDQYELDAFPERLQRWMRGAKIQPTVVFKETTALSVSELNQLIDRTENFLDQKMRQIHGATYFFVDKVDQAIHHLSRDAWIAIQAGLIEAAWETMNANSHIKIFASIRQEAFSNYESDIKSNLFASTTNLHYSEEELQALLDQLARCYENSQSFADFLGLNVVRHGRRETPEDSFQYVRRHTCSRPRDLVAIASEISAKRATLSERRLREIVQQTSSTVIVSNIFEELRVFLNCLGDRNERLRFLAMLPGNILDRTQAIRVCEDFNGLKSGTLVHFGEDSSDIYHPFRDLYIAGLLGVIEREPESGKFIQRFRRADDWLMNAATDLPDSQFFLIHPALDTFIRAQRTRKPFLQFQHIAVGESLLWESYFPGLMKVEQSLAAVEDHAFVERADEVIKHLRLLLHSVRPNLPRVEVETSDAWKQLVDDQPSDACTETLYWLEELLDELEQRSP